MLALLLLSAFVLAVSPELHRELHSDAGSPDHHCLITSIEAGMVEIAVTGCVPAVLILACFGRLPSFVEVLLPITAFRLLPGRAPPVRF